MKKLKTIAGTGEKTKSGKAFIPEVRMRGDVLATYVDLKARMEELGQSLASIEPLIKRNGAIGVFEANVGYGRPEVKSVKLVDNSGTAVRVTLAAVYPTMTVEEAEKCVSTWRRMDGEECDVNDYVVQTRQAKFDSKAFLSSTGDFNQKAFDKFFDACASVARGLGIDNPLSSEVVVAFRKTFDDVRYQHFDFPTQAKIYEAAPNRTSITIVPPEND